MRAKNVIYLNSVVGILQQYSYFRATINWDAVRQQAVSSVENGTPRTDAILAALKALNDNHSYYIPPGTASPLTPFVRPECAANQSPRLPFDWPSDIGFVAVGGFGGSGSAASAFATNLQATIRDQDRPGNAGWVVDLRHNTGGNYSPMISGVGPVLGEGLAGYFVRSDGSLIPWGYENGALWQFSPTSRDVLVTNPYRLSVPPRRIAVLTDSLTNSSGEATAVGFRGRADTKTFGGQTCGRSSSIFGHKLNDGGILGVMDSIDADRLGTNYGGGVLVPDERISDDLQLYARVVAWIRSGQ
jgi:carboxyl-terminal processing protease